MRELFKSVVLTILMLEAKLVIKKYKPRIVAITGSVGKTSTKDAIFSVVSSGAYVRKSEKSFNSEIGIPLTILGCPNGWGDPLRWMQNLIDGFFLIVFDARYPEWLVLEVGADRPGDIRSLASWLPVDVAVITRLPDMPVHVEFFDSPEQVAEEKASLIQALKPEGTLVLCADDERTLKLAVRAAGRKVITYGLSKTADVRADDLVPVLGADGYPTGMRAQVILGAEQASLEVSGTIGSHTLLTALAGIAVGSLFKKDLPTMTASFASYTPPPGRMRLLRGIKNTLIIDDTYNSSPAAAQAAIDGLALIGPHFATALHKRGRRIAMLSDMLELGRHSVEEHRKLGAYTAGKKISLLATVGFRARDIGQGAREAGMKEASVMQFDDAEVAGQDILNTIRPGDTVLVKGSQGMRMERVVKMLMLNPERAHELLVRQDEEWAKR